MEHFIECVKQFQCLWKADTPGYKNIELKDMAWMKVVELCEIADVAEAKSIWKKLRDGHRQALSRKKPLMDETGMYDRPWKYEKLMEFLIPYMATRAKSFILKNIPPSTLPQARTTKLSQTAPTACELSGLLHWDSTTSNCGTPEHIHSRGISSFSATDSPEIAQKRARSDVETNGGLKYVKKQVLVKENNGLDSFFKSMCEQTKELSQRLQMQVQRRVFDAVMEAKGEALRYQSKDRHSTSEPESAAHNSDSDQSTPLDVKCEINEEVLM